MDWGRRWMVDILTACITVSMENDGFRGFYAFTIGLVGEL